MSRILFAAKHSWTTLHISRHIICVVSYLQVTWWALGQSKERNICIEVIISIITPFLYKKQSKLTKILTDVWYITFSQPKDGLVTSGSKEGKSALLFDS